MSIATYSRPTTAPCVRTGHARQGSLSRSRSHDELLPSGLVRARQEVVTRSNDNAAQLWIERNMQPTLSVCEYGTISRSPRLCRATSWYAVLLEQLRDGVQMTYVRLTRVLAQLGMRDARSRWGVLQTSCGSGPSLPHPAAGSSYLLTTRPRLCRKVAPPCLRTHSVGLLGLDCINGSRKNSVQGHIGH